MVSKVKVIDAETGNEIRIGPVRGNEINQTLLFGFLSMADALKIGTAMFGIVTFLITDNLRIKNLEEGQAKLAKISESMLIYMTSADNFHSAHFGVEFRGGRPIEGTLRRKEGR